MTNTDWTTPLLYVLLGAFVLWLVLQLRRLVQRRSHRKDADTPTLDARVIGDAHTTDTTGRQWRWESPTPREMEIAQLVAQGQRNSEMAHALHISVHTVETHLTHIYAKLQVRSRIELARAIRELVLVGKIM